MEKQLKDKEISATKDGFQVYEVSFLLLPSLAESQVPAKVSSLKDVITSAGGEIVSGEEPILIDLAYGMTKVIQTIRHKANRGYFGWLKFEITAEGIEAVKKALDNADSILRYIIIKTVRENTLLNGKMKLQKEERVRRSEEETAEVAPEVVLEDVDKSIDALVV